MQRCSAWVGLDRGKLSFLVKSFALRALMGSTLRVRRLPWRFC